MCWLENSDPKSPAVIFFVILSLCFILHHLQWCLKKQLHLGKEEATASRYSEKVASARRLLVL